MANPSNWDLLSAISGFVDQKFDYLKVTYPSATEETYTYRNGGATGTVISVFTVTYTSSAKTDVDSVLRTT